jgi:hypothetical protein
MVMGIMFFAEGSQQGTGGVVCSARTARTLVLDYVYTWRGQHIVGRFTATPIGHGTWSGTWDDHALSASTRWSGPADLVEARVGRLRVFTGTWALRRTSRRHPWLVVR